MADKRYMLAVDIGSTNIKARIYDGKFKVQASNSKQVFDIFFVISLFTPSIGNWNGNTMSFFYILLSLHKANVSPVAWGNEFSESDYSFSGGYENFLIRVETLY